MKKIILIFLFIISFVSNAQQSIATNISDTIILNTATTNSAVQWQQSTDNITWVNIQSATSNSVQLTVETIPSYFRAKITAQDCIDSYYSEVITIIENVTIQGELWSNPATWGAAGKPVAGDVVTIPTGKHILLDENTPALDGLTIAGSLTFLEQDLALTSKWIMINQGTLRIGFQTQPFTHKATITITGNDMQQSIMGMGTRGIMVMGGFLELHGALPNLTWTKINAHAPVGSTSLTLLENVNWKVGDEIIIGPTDYFEASNGASITQKVKILSVSGNQITIDQPLNAFHWGLLQYATPSGISLSATNLINPPLADTNTEITPRILDERAPVGNLSRNIIIEAPNDALWQNEGFGVHVMIMMLSSKAHVEGVEFRRAGQSGRLGRYAFHWHRLSYGNSESLGDATGHYFRNCAINSSMNRGVVLHATNGVEIKNNVIYDIKGHAIFTEDAVERRNIIDSNLVMHVRNPAPGKALKLHESGSNDERGSSAFWISNPDNTITNNTAADNGSFGFWLAFPAQPMGLSGNVLGSDGLLLNPGRLRFGIFDNNTTHSNKLEGIMFDNMESDNDGNTTIDEYTSTIDGHEPVWPFTTQRRFSLTRYKTWKNGKSGIWDRSKWVDNLEVVNADNAGRYFAGAGTDGTIQRSLVIGTSLNDRMNGTVRPPVYDTMGDETPTAFATYHSTFDIKNNIAINFPMQSNKRSGVFATEDYYTRPVEKGQFRNTNNLMVASHSGVKLRSAYSHFTLASALWDPNGIWGPANQYFVYDEPFLTHGLVKTTVLPGAAAGGVSVPGPFYGFYSFVLNNANAPWADVMAIHVKRLDQNMNQVATWDVAGTYLGNLLDHMRDFAVHPSGIYELSFPDEPSNPTAFEMEVENMLTTNDQVVMSISFDGNINASVAMLSYGNSRAYQELSSLQQVRNSNGETYWQDHINNKVWVKIKGGFWNFWTNEIEPTSDETLYEPTKLTIFGQ